MGSVGQTFFGGSKSKENSASTSGNNAWPYIQGMVGPAVNYLPAGGSYLGTLLGIPGYGSPATGQSGSATPMPTGGGGGYTGPSLSDIQKMRNDGIPGNYRAAMAAYQNRPQASAAPMPTPTSTPATAGSQTSALQTFADSAGMKFLEDNGNRMINNNQAAKGLLGSGSTLKGLADYSENLHQTYLNNYLDRVLGFAKLGDAAAGTLATAGAYSNSTGTGNSSSKPGILPGMQKAAAALAGGA